MNSEKIKLQHPKPMSAGFFSYCSVYLNQIIEHIKNKKKLDNLELGEFEFYKKNNKEKVYESFFDKPSTIINLEQKNKLIFPSSSSNIFYKKTDNLHDNRIIDKWFTPKKEIKIIKNNFIIDLNLKTRETLALYYRGTDTQNDRKITNYNIFAEKAKCLIDRYKIKTILLQTDDKMFQDYILSCGIKERILQIKEIPSVYSHIGYHFTTKEDKIFHTQTILASTLLMSECKCVLCNSSNLSRWILIYRKSKDDYYQFIGNRCL